MWPALLVLPWFYYWLKGQWFARVLAMLFWVPVVLITAKKPLDAIPAPKDWEAIMGVITLVSFVIIEWLMSSLPAYVKAWREDSPRALRLHAQRH